MAIPSPNSLNIGVHSCLQQALPSAVAAASRFQGSAGQDPQSPLCKAARPVVSSKGHCTENQDLSLLRGVCDAPSPEQGLRREATPTSPRSAISLCTSLFGTVWAFTLASMTEREFFKLSAFLRAWRGTEL